MKRRHALVSMSVIGLVPWSARAQNAAYPVRPVSLVVPFAAGSSSDTLARLISSRAAVPFGGSFIIDNRPGAGGLVAVQRIARAAPDGYSLMWGGGTAITHAVMQADPGYDVMKDFAPVVTLAEHPAVLGVRADRPWKSIQDVFTAARAARDGPLRYGSGGIGTPAHMAAAAMLKLIGAEGIHVPYKGANQATLAVEQGEVDFAFAISNIALPRHQIGRIRILASSGSIRMTALPEVPTLAETIRGGPVVISGSSIIGPAGLPSVIVDKLAAAFAEVMSKDEDLRRRIAEEGGSVVLSASPAAYRDEWAVELRRLKELVALSGVRAE
ncbi:MAG: Bug family tripartite tricarboxylate transporter substrate binding protein [Betaproteobacteria bacterium]